ncbi:hypothetical protein LUZ60_002045 [Juncus effusus]|nr:hypothetical protein LUZ60_002045 [Juncus effusus]
MEGPQILRPNGKIISLPPGFRFDPTDQELLVHYLKPKILSFPLPADIIPEIELRKYDPWDLPGTYDKERYFFNQTKSNEGNNSRNVTRSGFWKVTGKDQPIMAGSRFNNRLIGTKRVLKFYMSRPTRGSRQTNWIMHEYHLIETDAIHQKRNSIVVNWTVCRVFRKNKYAKSNKQTKYRLNHDERTFGSDSSSSCMTCLSDEGEENNYDCTTSSSP